MPLRRWHRSVATAAALVAALGLVAGCGSKSSSTSASSSTDASASSGQKITLRLAHTAPPGNDQYVAANMFAKEVKEKTGGNVTVQVFPNSQLGAETDIIKKMQQGTIDIGYLSTTVTASVVPEVGVFDLPYLFPDYKSATAAVTGDAVAPVDKALEAKGFHNLGYSFLGFRETLCKNTVIKAPTYYDGVKLRVPNSPISLATFKAWKAASDPLEFNEVLTAMQTGVVDCVESTDETMLNSKFADVAKKESVDNHQFGFLAILMNADKYNSLSPDYQQALTEAAADASAVERKVTQANSLKARKTLESQGVTVTNVDTSGLQAGAAKVRADFGKQIHNPELVNTVHGGS